VIKLHHQAKDHIIGHLSTFVKFRKIPRKRENSAAWLKIPQPAENCGPYWSTSSTALLAHWSAQL